MRSVIVLSGLALTLITACKDSAAPAGSGDVTATLQADQVLIHNGTDQRVHLALSDQEDTNAILWQICAGSDCPALEPGTDEIMLLSDLGPLSPETQAVLVHWWHAVADDEGQFQPDSIRTIRLAL